VSKEVKFTSALSDEGDVSNSVCLRGGLSAPIYNDLDLTREGKQSAALAGKFKRNGNAQVIKIIL
jgi:hypothetical protein